MFSVFQCARLAPLAGHLLSQVERAPLAPLEPEVVVVGQNRGLRAWLSNALAERTGCAASLEMPSPRALCMRLARQFVASEGEPERDRRDPFHPESLEWRVAALLDDLPEDDGYAPLRAYLDGGPGRTLPLARRISERLGDYQVYRPRLLEQWARGERPYDKHPHAAWQAALWRRLVAGADRPDRGRQLLALQEALRAREVAPERLPARVSIFGAGLFPPLYLDVLAALARQVEVRFYLVSPDALGEETARSALAERLGEQRRLLADLLAERCDAAQWTTLAAGGKQAGTNPETALEAAQTSVPPPRPPAPLSETDRSLTVHSCHSRRRELEVLRDQLFDAFDALPELAPADVLVAVPNLDEYAPLIHTVFEAESGAGVQLPVHIASAQHGAERRVLRAAAALLALPGGRFTAPEVMQLLDYPVLRRAAGIAPADVPTVRGWVRETGIRWGRDATHRAAYAETEAAGEAGTWRAGLDRLLLGHVAGAPDAPVEGRLPYAEASTDRAELLGCVVAWLHRLMAFAEDAQRARSLTAWGKRLATLFDTLLAPETDAEHDAVQHLAETTQDLDPFAPAAEGPAAEEEEAQRSVSFTDARERVEAAIRMYEARTEYVTGRVTFAPPMALRFAPYRVVAFLGLGDTYPPAEARPADDLIAAAPRPSDHDPEREGEQLFHDALHAATDRLVVTYVGRSDTDDAERAPSAVLEALLETCEAAVAPAEGDSETVRERLVTEHPLQPFHPGYFSGDGKLFSYDRAHASQPSSPGAAFPPPFFDGPPLPEDEAAPVVRLDDLQRAWAHPSKFFCTRVLGLRLEGEAALDDQQPISPGALAAYRARQEALAAALGEVPRGGGPAGAARLEADGVLPPGRQGEAWFARQRAEAETVARAVQQRGARQPRTLRAEGDGWAVAGRLDHVAESGALAFRCASLKAKDFVRAWPAHLLLCAAGTPEDPRETHLIGGGGEAWRFGPLDAVRAQHFLYRLVRGYRAIRRAPRPFFPASALACVEASNDYYEKRDARRAFYDGYRDGEESDPYVALCFRGRDPLAGREAFDLFRRWAKAFYDPVLETREKA